MQVELVLLILSLLFFVSIISDKIGYKFGVPALLLFLSVGMLFGAGSSVLGIERLEIDTENAQALSTVALCIILFSGGMDTKLSDIKSVLAPGITLATIGVLVTCLITGVTIYYIFGWLHAVQTISIWMALLIAATMSSTDSASVFSIMRVRHIGLKHDLRPLLELESGANDPMAYVLTTTLIGIVLSMQGLAGISGVITLWPIMRSVIVQLIMGTALGFALGEGLVLLMRRVQLASEALYPIMVLTACIFMSQLVMFLMLGLMVHPGELIRLQVWLPCLIISIVMIIFARPAAVFFCMASFKRYRMRDKVMLSWVGLKGAVPIIFAIMCKASGVPSADVIFNVVFLCTLVSLLMQGMTITWLAQRLNLATPPDETKRLVHFDMDLPDEIQSTAHELEVTEEMLVSGCTLREIQMPPHTLIIMVRRGEDFFVPTGASELLTGDQLLVITDHDADAAYRQLTNEAEEEAQWRADVRARAKERFQRFQEWLEAPHMKTKSKLNNQDND